MQNDIYSIQRKYEKHDNGVQTYFEKEVQVTGDLGDKISEAFKHVFKQGGKVIVIGSDCYDLSAELMEEAFQKLNNSDVVIGPANDGGYYLLGIKKFHQRAIFKH